MKGAKVLFAQPRPPRAIGRRPEIARQAADEAFTAIVDLDEFLPTLIAAFRFFAFRRHEMDGSRKTPVGGTSATVGASVVATAFSSQRRWPMPGISATGGGNPA
jgi:hypothetical protein